MTTVSTHVLDAAQGRPAAGLGVVLLDADSSPIESATTDADGRVRWRTEVRPGDLTLGFDTGRWFAEQGRDTFFPHVGIAFAVAADQDHYHVALLLSPYSYTTYRGS